MILRLSQSQVAVLYPLERYGLQKIRKGVYQVVERWWFEELKEAFSRWYDVTNPTHRALQRSLQAVR